MLNKLKEKLKNKTFKRETAWLLIGVLGYAVYGGDVAMVEAIVYPILMFAGLAFGLDWNTKQLQR